MKPIKSTITIFMMVIAAIFVVACPGGGGGGGPTSTYTLSGRVSSMVSGTVVEGVKVSLSTAPTTSTYTNANGHYSFSGLANGSYTITASFTGAQFSPATLAVTINGADATNKDILALQGGIVADNVGFLPGSFSSNNQLRASLSVAGDDLIFTDSSNFPLKKLSRTDLTMTSLASRFSNAESVVLYGQNVFWIQDGQLNKTSLDGTTTTVLARGIRDLIAGATADLVVDATDVYWVNTVASPSCAPSCIWTIQKVPLSSGSIVTLATVSRPVTALAADADHLYWEEASPEPVSPGCQCGSTIKAMPKAGGATVLLVDNSLNGTMPAPPPGYTPGSWIPAGGLAVTATAIVFGVASDTSYSVETVLRTGGSITTLATVSSSAGIALNSLRVDGNNVYWVDGSNRTLNSVPLAGGSVTALANGLGVSAYGTPLAINGTSAFWTETGAPGGCCLQMGAGRIRQVPLAGGGVSTVIGNLDAPAAIAVDSGNLVWTEAWRVAKAPVGGGTPTTLVSGIGSNMARIAVDQSNVYILDGDLVKTVPLAGGKVEKLASAKFGTIGDFSNINQDIATDGVSVYWTIKENMAAPVVQKVSIAGGPPVTLATMPGFPSPQDCYWRILVDTQNVYWSSGSFQFPIGCSINKVPIGGGAVTTMLDVDFLYDFTVDATDLYYSTDNIRKIPIAGGTPTLVATNVGAWVLINDADRLYWIDASSSKIGTISKAAGTATSASVLFPLALAMDPMLAAEALVVDSGILFCTEAPAGYIDVLY